MPTFRHLTSTEQLTRDWVEKKLFPSAEKMSSRTNGEETLRRRALYCLFYEPSFVTRASFERAIELLGGDSYHTEDASQFFPEKTPNYIENIMSILASLRIDLVVLRSSDPTVMDRASSANALSIINGGSSNDHPTQAAADIWTMKRELGGVDGATVVIIGRPEHRNVSALLKGLTMFKDVNVVLVPFSGQVDPVVASYCESRGLKLTTTQDIEAVRNADAIYLNGPRTVAHVQLLKARASSTLRIDAKFMGMLKQECIILDPMQRSGDFTFETQDRRLAFYRQAENALYVRMSLLAEMLA
ncbi:MAG: hypothetical protein FJ319_11690 [SAR202 cluster bacterium]|nr:hypothetical protein [SAR202 cluster bacterium]